MQTSVFKNHLKNLSLIGLIVFGVTAFTGNASAATEFISTIKQSGGDYSSLSTWENALAPGSYDMDISVTTTRVFSGTKTGTLSNGDAVELYRGDADQNVDATVVATTSTQILLRLITTADLVLQADDQWRLADSEDNMWTVAGTGAELGDTAIAVAQIDGTWANPDTTAVVIDGWTTSAANYIKIYTTAEARHDGKWNEGKYRLEIVGYQSIIIGDNYVRIEGLQISLDTASGSDSYGINITGIGTNNDIRISYNIIRATVIGDSQYRTGIRVYEATPTVNLRIWNNIIYDWLSSYAPKGMGISLHCNTAYIYNNTISGCSRGGIAQGAGAVDVINNAVFNNSDDFYGSFNLLDYNASDDNNGTNAINISPGATEADSWTDAFVDYVNNDFHITLDSVLKNVGTDLTAQGFSTDIDSQTRPWPTGGDWDIGADEYVDVTAPSGYTVSIDQAYINTTNQTALSFTFASAEVGATYNYSIDDTNIGSPVAGSGTVVTATDTISNIDVSGLDDDTLTLTVYLTDPANNQGANVTDTVVKETVLSTITNISSNKTNGSYTIGEVIDIDLTFSETVTSGSVTVTLETGATDRTCSFAISNSLTGTCDYTVQAGDTSLDLNVNDVSGTITDQAGNAMINFTPATNLESNKEIVIDAVAPTLSEVTSISPATDTTPSYTFNTTEAGTITYSGSCSSSTTSAILGNNTITLNELTPGTYSDCTIIVTDALNNSSDALAITSFTINSTGGGFISPAPPVIPLSPNQTFEINIIENEATINLNNIQNVYQIAISTTPDFKYVSWEPYQEKIVLPDSEKVYIKFRSEAGGVSEVYEVETRHCLVPTPIDLPNGSLVRMINDYKVYILNNNYLRHIIDEIIFSFYGHLNKEDIQVIETGQCPVSTLANSCQESFLIREANDYKVYLIEDNKKQWLNITVEEFEERYDWEEVYVVNGEELGWYEG